MTDQNNLLVFLLNMNLLILHLLFLNINLLIGGAQLVLVRRMSSPTSKPPHKIFLNPLCLEIRCSYLYG